MRIGRPSGTFPWAWSIVRWIDGVDVADVSPAERASTARPLAEFMAALHVPAPDDAPKNPVRGVPLADRDAAVQQRLAQLAERMPVAGLAKRWRTALEAPPWDGPPLWLHGDPHPGNLLLTPDHSRLAAVIDFGDVTAGDPATDLATAWSRSSRMRGRSSARTSRPSPVDEATWMRATGWAVAMATALAAHSDDNPRMRSLATHALAQLA